jgi:hypothetical protein
MLQHQGIRSHYVAAYRVADILATGADNHTPLANTQAWAGYRPGCTTVTPTPPTGCTLRFGNDGLCDITWAPISHAR